MDQQWEKRKKMITRIVDWLAWEFVWLCLAVMAGMANAYAILGVDRDYGIDTGTLYGLVAITAGFVVVLRFVTRFAFNLVIGFGRYVESRKRERDQQCSQ